MEDEGGLLTASTLHENQLHIQDPDGNAFVCLFDGFLCLFGTFLQ